MRQANVADLFAILLEIERGGQFAGFVLHEAAS
jgi:hypothetical protein